MTDWTTIPNSSLETGKPIRAVDGRALRDNPIAISEGATGAPRINPILAMAHQGALGAVGTYAMLSHQDRRSLVANEAYAGSVLRYHGVNVSNDNTLSARGGTPGAAPAGTWRVMGQIGVGAYISDRPATLFLRIA